MSETTKGTSVEQVSVEISYCPCLGIYHYRQVGGAEYFWDNDQLEKTLTVYLSEGKTTDAEWMARLTTAARETPHKILSFRSDGRCVVREPEVPAWVADLSASEPNKSTTSP